MSQPLKERPWVLWLVMLGVLAFANSFNGAFVLDDIEHIVQDYDIRTLWPPWDALFGKQNYARPLVGLSFAINYAISELRPWSYHLFNLVIHLVGGVALFRIIRRSLNWQDRSAPIAFAISALWVVHPLQTESVTYITQRFESLMGMFFLLSFERFTRWTTLSKSKAKTSTLELNKHQRWTWVFASASMLCKQVGVTLPLILFLYDRAFVSGSFRQAWAKRKGFYFSLLIPVLVTVVLIKMGPKLEWAGTSGNTLGEKIQSSFDYATSQAKVILFYLRLILFPNELCLDYSWPTPKGFGENLPWVVALMPLLVGTGVALVRMPKVGFVAASFFVILAPSSSFLPIADLVVEHRLYLPLAPALTLLVVGILHWKPQWYAFGKWALLAALTILTALTLHRNQVYESPLKIWEDVVRKRPDNTRALNNYATLLIDTPRVQEATEIFQRIFQMRPDYYEARSNFGLALTKLDRVEEAYEQFREVVRLKPDFPEGLNNLGTVLCMMGRPSEGVIHFAESLKFNPHSVETLTNYGRALGILGRKDEAIQALRRALEISPHHQSAILELRKLMGR